MTHPRLLAARGDVAAAHLKGQIEAGRYVEPVDMQVTAGVAAIRRTPRDDGPMDTQALFGEVFAVLEEKDGWAWGFSRHDGYVGYIDMAALSAPVRPVTHRVSALRTYLFSGPDLKSAPHCLLSMNAKINAGEKRGRFVDAGGSGWVFEGHLVSLDHAEPDYVTVAERFAGTPYLWGGKESLGLDCSGLVQTSLEAAGISILRDTDMQESELAARFSTIAADAPRQRGDIVFWSGHVGIMVDETRILHANAHYLQTVIEPVSETERRAVSNDSPVTSVFRLTA
ncbi:C40 family peptidase [Hyphobacterium indicum]|uniref:C40 family peptidase n=1 Tax=Hyphobacterium indicum TaxID=2162714 RepID=UPI000D650592|nr:C40 family peptidase [Hyphobacterium indicum]